ncbi:hypothetical protein F4677DRAFT_431255 [Hypoxylon crocopeplum]|nr:hypothetical protein F4677DRAFT_431255 [Hypoxylon crocopeplum]
MQGDDIFAHTSSAPAHKERFDINELRSGPKVSEALLSTDWRNNRPNGFGGAPLEPPATAGLEPTEFQVNMKKRNIKGLSVNTSLANQGGARHYKESPVDPDLIHSAPITKKDYEDTEEESGLSYEEEIRDSSDNTKALVPTSATDKRMVLLDTYTPTTRAGFEQVMDWRNLRLQHTPTGDQWSCGDIPLKAIPQSSLPDEDAHDTFPIASVKAIKNAKRFNGSGWDDVMEDVNKTLARLEVPHTAGLPPDRLRIEYERGQLALAAKVTMEEPAIKTTEVESYHHGAALSSNVEPKEFGSDGARFSALVDKLERSSTSRSRAQPTIGIKPSRPSKESEENASASKDSDDSGVSGVVKSKKNRTIALNPQATEFHSNAVQRLDDASDLQAQKNNQLGSNIVLQRETTDNGAATTKQHTSPEKNGDLKEILAHMTARAEASEQRMTQQMDMFQNMWQTMASQMRQNSGGYEAPPQSQYPESSAYSSGTWSGAQSQGSYIPSQPQPQPAPGFASGPGSMGLATYNAGPYTNGGTPPMPAPSYGYGGPQNSQFPMGPQPYQPAYPQAPSYPSQASQYHSQAPQYHSQAPPVGPSPVQGYGDPASMPLYAQAQMAFPPKPVLKPKGPPIPHHQGSGAQQMAYENYLEVKRSTDPEYARACRERQARRAGRQRQDRNQMAPGGQSRGPGRY